MLENVIGSPKPCELNRSRKRKFFSPKYKAEALALTGTERKRQEEGRKAREGRKNKMNNARVNEGKEGGRVG